jgi:hypothetical protein
MGALEAEDMILLRYPLCVAQVLNQLERRAEREDFGAFDVFDIVGELAAIAVISDVVAIGVFSRLFLIADLAAELGNAAIHLGLPLLDLVMDVESLAHVLLLRDLEAEHELVVLRHPIKRVAGGIGPTMFQRLQHPGHLAADIAARAPMN